MQCKPCLGNGQRRDGADLGLCWQHRKKKCRLCGEFSAGKVYCTRCEHQTDIDRWAAEAKASWTDEENDYFQLKLRKERLWEAKYHTHRATEILFRALALTLEAVWGGIKTPEEIVAAELPRRPVGNRELKKAA